MNRRHFLSASLGLFLASLTDCGPKTIKPDLAKQKTLDTSAPTDVDEQKTSENNDGLLTLIEFAKKYASDCLPRQTNMQAVNILYPGSGFDLSPVKTIGSLLLQKTLVNEVNFTYTEIGDFESAPSFHDGQNDLIDRINEEFDKLAKEGFIDDVTHDFDSKSLWIRKNVPHSAVVKYACNVNVGPKRKRLNLNLGYNAFDNREELSNEQRAYLSPQLIANARQNYWPQKTEVGKLYPTYFLQEQFDECDILLSKQCGDFALLQLDYIRALANTKRKKQRAILTEHANKLDAVRTSLPAYATEVIMLSNNDYGYCTVAKNSCKVGMLITTPK